MTLRKYELTSETIQFNPTLQFDGDLWVLDREGNNGDFDRTTLLTVVDDGNKSVKIRIDWCNFSGIDCSFSMLLIPETGKLFFGAKFFWGLVDIENVVVERQENCTVFWSFERRGDTIVVISELEAESMTLSGETIDKVPIDPPFECKESEDKIEFTSPVFGVKTLKLRI